MDIIVIYIGFLHCNLSPAAIVYGKHHEGVIEKDTMGLEVIYMPGIYIYYLQQY